MRIPLPEDLAIDAEVDLCSEKGEYFLQARLKVSIPGLDKDLAQKLVDYAHTNCPYSKAKCLHYEPLAEGHFAAWEQPLLFASELRAAFESLRSPK